MNFWNIAIPTLTLAAPFAACLYFLLSGGTRLETAPKWGTAVFGILLLASALGVIRFESPVRLEFLWPFAAEPSGYFEFSLQLHWPRFVWIFFSSFVLLVFSIFDGRSSFLGSSRGSKFMFLAGASLASSLAFLSENAFLSFLFVEVTMFLLYAFSVLGGVGEESQERASYFKRGGFIFLALLAVLCLSFTRQLDLSSILFLGAVLYVIAFVFSRHGFPDWRYLALALLQAGAVFFLLGRVMGEDMSQDLLLPLSTVFAATVCIFAWFSLASASTLGSSFWMLFSFMAYLLFLRFSSGRHGDQFWGTYEAIGLLAVLSIGSLMRFGRRAAGGGERAAAFICSALLLAIVSGAIPGVDIAGARASLESPVKLMGLGLLSFLLALIVGKGLAVSFSKENPEPDAPSFFPGLLPSLATLVVQAAAVVKMTDLYGESPFRMGLPYLLTNLHILVAIAAIFLGLLAGALLGFNSRFVGWIRSKEVKMEDLFPRIDPAIVAWNGRMVDAPRAAADWVTSRSSGASSKGADLLRRSDHAVFGDRFYGGFRHYGDSLSRLTRRFHTGNVRAYVFAGVVVTLFASALFLLEGR